MRRFSLDLGVSGDSCTTLSAIVRIVLANPSGLVSARVLAIYRSCSGGHAALSLLLGGPAMPLKPSAVPSIREETMRVARAAFPYGNAYLTLRDALGIIFADEDLAPFFPS